MREYEEEEDDEMYGPPPKRDSWRNRDQPPPPKLPKLEDQKPMIGPTDSEGKIKVHYKAAIDGYLTDPKDMMAMAEAGLPTGFTFGSNNRDSRLQQKKQKATYYCDLCKLELNSEDTMKAHMAGSKHMKKTLAAAQQQDIADIPSIRPIQNPASTRVKIPIRLQVKISDSPLPVVGLNFIKEYIACSNSEMEPHYECDLCGTQGQANCMFQHLVGARHRQAAVDDFYNNDPEKISLTQAELLRFAEDYNENDDRISERITTKYSDDEYPWPAGMEPWLIERGGSGIIPDGARCNGGKTAPKPSQNRSLSTIERKPMPFASASICGISPIHGTSKSQASQVSIKDLQPHDIKDPRTKDEALRMINTGSDLLFMAMEFNKANREDCHMMSLMMNLIKSAVLKQRGNHKSVRSPSSTRSFSSSSVDTHTSRERSSSRDYESSRRRRDDRRHQDSWRHDRDRSRETRDSVKAEPRSYGYDIYDNDRRRGSHNNDEYRRDDRRSRGYGYYN